MPPPDWLLVLRPLADDVPPGRRIARVLKVLKRHRLRCVEVCPCGEVTMLDPDTREALERCRYLLKHWIIRGLVEGDETVPPPDGDYARATLADLESVLRGETRTVERVAGLGNRGTGV